MIKRNLAAKVNAENNSVPHLLDHLKRLESKMDVLGEHFENKIKFDETKNEQIKQLHELAHSFRGDLLKKAMEPLINEIIDFVSQLQFEKEEWEKQFEIVNMNEQNENGLKVKVLEKVARNYFNIDKDLNGMLKKFGISPIISDEGDEYNPNIHKIIDTKVVEGREKKSGRIYKSILTGYLWNNKIYKAEGVIVYVNESQILKKA